MRWYGKVRIRPVSAHVYHMYTNWTLLLTTILYAMVLFDDIYDVQNKVYVFLCTLSMCAAYRDRRGCGLLLGSGANDFDKAISHVCQPQLDLVGVLKCYSQITLNT